MLKLELLLLPVETLCLLLARHCEEVLSDGHGTPEKITQALLLQRFEAALIRRPPRCYLVAVLCYCNFIGRETRHRCKPEESLLDTSLHHV